MTGPATWSGLPAADAAAGAAQPHALGVPRAVQPAPMLWGLGPDAHPVDPGPAPYAGMPTGARATAVSGSTQTIPALAAGAAPLVVPGV